MWTTWHYIMLLLGHTSFYFLYWNWKWNCERVLRTKGVQEHCPKKVSSISKIPPKQIQLETWSSHSVHTCIHHTGSKVWTAIQLFIHASGSQTDVTPERERERVHCLATLMLPGRRFTISITQYHYLPLSSQISLLRHFWLVVHISHFLAQIPLLRQFWYRLVIHYQALSSRIPLLRQS